MNRRTFLAVVAGIAATRCANAQQATKVYRIAIVHPSAKIAALTEAGGDPALVEFFKELRRLGYLEGENLVVERHSGEGRIERDAQLARNAAATNPDVIFGVTTRILLALKAATATIPIVGLGGDPVAQGLVSNLARPGGNITGASIDAGLDLYGKRLEILKEAVPSLSRVALLVPRAAWEGTVLPHYIGAMREAADQAGIRLIGAPVGSPADENEYRRIFATLPEARVDALIAEAFAENFTQRRLIVELSATTRLPAIYPFRDFVEIGGLMAYSVDLIDISRRVAIQIDQILKGGRPGDIPFHQPTKFELVINLKTAKALGLTIPSTLLARADEVIE